MLKEFEERITDAKNKQFRMLERFHIGDAVYPFWLKGIVVYGIVTDVDTVARKVFCDFNGVRRQFCPEDLMHVNPELINASTVKKRNASDGTYSKQDETHLSDDTDNGINATCKKCGGEIAVSYDEKTATTDFVCTKCGNRIPEDKLTKETKKAMREDQARNAARTRKADFDEYDEFVEKLDALPLDDTQYWYYHDALDAIHEGSSNRNDTHGYDSMEDVLEDAENCGDADEYDADHAAEWMEKHPYGWYNSEHDKGTGDENDEIDASRSEMAKELVRVAKSLIRKAAEDGSEDCLLLNEAFESLKDAYPEHLDYDMGWKQDILNGVIYINYYGGEEDDGFEVTFNVSCEDGLFTVVAVDFEGTEVVGPDNYSDVESMVDGFKSYFPVIDRHIEEMHRSAEEDAE